MYWDAFTYFDAANRILTGQIPTLDFFTPAGPLGYTVAAIWIAVFPNGQPSLLIHWSTMTVTVPLMALVLAGVPRTPRMLGLLLVVPFLLFSLLPFNGKEFSSFPGSDAFGFYNRQTRLILYPLVCGLLFTRHRGVLITLVTISMFVLFFWKITGFLAAGLICAFALLAGRLRMRDAAFAAVFFAATLALIEVWTGIVSSYIADVYTLVQMNSGTLFPRIAQALSINFGIVTALSALILALLVVGRSELQQAFAVVLEERSTASVASFLDRPAFWLAAITIAGVFFETQNTASQALIFIWPALLWVLLTLPSWAAGPHSVMLVAGLVGAAYLPPVVSILERTARAYVGGLRYASLEHENLKTLGAVTARASVLRRSEVMTGIYEHHRSTYDEIAASGELPGSTLYSEFDFQITYLQTVDRAINSLRTLEARSGVHFDTIMSLNFTNPFPWLMERKAPLHITVGADPFRAVAAPDADVERAVSSVDIALMPTCPPTDANARLLALFAGGLSNHQRIKLDDCYDAFIHPKFGPMPPSNS
ncbi:hypothetical protein [uncultured Nitratireductor sp.]|uniref:hypothetical protein n=1 Tax=uncultured Nitratireductor sp. TaxID=520953 RepID=UPI002602A2B7|nr:hypothetical protein [uncultured Nitratireductor sp.]